MGNRPGWSKAITARVKRAIDASDLTRHRVATLTGIPKTTFDRRYFGHDAWTTTNLEDIAGVLDLDPEDFVASDDIRQAAAS